MNCAVSTASNACAVCASTGRNASRPASASLDRWAFVSAMPANQFSRGELAAADPATAGRAVFDATARFHNPTHARSGPTLASMPPSRVSGRWCFADWAPRSPMGVPELVLPASASAPSGPRGPSQDFVGPAVARGVQAMSITGR